MHLNLTGKGKNPIESKYCAKVPSRLHVWPLFYIKDYKLSSCQAREEAFQEFNALENADLSALNLWMILFFFVCVFLCTHVFHCDSHLSLCICHNHTQNQVCNIKRLFLFGMSLAFSSWGTQNQTIQTLLMLDGMLFSCTKQDSIKDTDTVYTCKNKLYWHNEWTHSCQIGIHY